MSGAAPLADATADAAGRAAVGAGRMPAGSTGIARTETGERDHERLLEVVSAMMSKGDTVGDGVLSLDEFKVLCGKVSEDDLSTGLDALLASW